MRLAVGHVVIAGVDERDETGITLRPGRAFEGPIVAAQGRWRRAPVVAPGDAADTQGQFPPPLPFQRIDGSWT